MRKTFPKFSISFPIFSISFPKFSIFYITLQKIPISSGFLILAFFAFFCPFQAVFIHKNGNDRN